MLSHFWLRLGKYALALLLIYLVVAYGCLITIIIRKELAFLDAVSTISALRQEAGPSTLEGQVRNVFGDVVPHAVLAVDNHLIQADNTGAFFLPGLSPGRCTLEIFAGNYAKYRREIYLEIGKNSPPIKYETGLWPQEFLVDFHIYYTEIGDILGIAGFANGAAEPIYIEKAILVDPQGEVIADLLHDHDGFSYYANLSTKINIVEVPRKALKWAPQMWQSGEFGPLKGTFFPGPYTLEVHYAFKEGHESGQYTRTAVVDHLDLESAPDPHSP